MRLGNSRNRPGMIRRMLGIVIGILFAVTVGMCWNTVRTSAAGANITIHTKNTTVAEGDTVYLLITVESSQGISGFEGYFPYDNRVLQFQTGGSVVYGNDDEFRIVDVERNGTEKQIKYSVKFRARHEGNTTITLKKPYNVFGKDTSEKLSVSYNTLTIVVKKKESGNHTPAPTADAQKLQENQPSAPTESPSPSPSATPKKKKKKKAKATAVPEETPVVPEKVQKVPKSGVHAVNSKNNVIVYGSASIEIMEPEAEQIPQGFGKTELDLDGQTVPAYALESNTEHTYVLLYGKSGDQERFYLYDKEQDSLLPYDQVRAWYRSNTDGIVSEKESQAELRAKRLQYVVGILLAFCALMLLAVVSLFMKYKGLDADKDLDTDQELDDGK